MHIYYLHKIKRTKEKVNKNGKYQVGDNVTAVWDREF